LVLTLANKKQAIAVEIRNLGPLEDVTVSFDKSILGGFHSRDDSNGCWVTFIAGAIIATMR
jgi:hypothetical protein